MIKRFQSLRRTLVHAAWGTTRRRWMSAILTLLGIPACIAGIVLAFWTLPIVRGHLTAVLNPNAARGLVYFHDSERSVPWSMHVVKFSRTRPDLELHSLMGLGNRQGMETVTKQVKTVPPAWGRPIAAINGDLYNSHPDYPGDPEGLQISHGELVSAPSDSRACFWIDPQGNPRRGDVRSRFEVQWPDGSLSPFGLNEARTNDAAVLYTAAAGPTTHTQGGIDLILESTGTGPWLPLRVGESYTARIRSVNRSGNSTLTPDILVLSLDPTLAKHTPSPNPGQFLRLSTATTPSLKGISTAIGGGPTLVAQGRPMEWSGVRLRHPRTAIGWNRDTIYLVVVDGRQLRLSAGMTLPELADYLVKLGCEEALNLDGGGSTTCLAYGAVRNSPSQGRERPAANALVVLKTTPKPLATARSPGP